MIMWMIGALSCEPGVDDPRQLVGHGRECDQVRLAPLTLAVIKSVEHRVETARGKRRMPDRPAQVWRAALAHLRLAGRLPGLMELGVAAHQRHQLIGIGEAPDGPDLGVDGRGGRRPPPGIVRRYRSTRE